MRDNDKVRDRNNGSAVFLGESEDGGSAPADKAGRASARLCGEAMIAVTNAKNSNLRLESIQLRAHTPIAPWVIPNLVVASMSYVYISAS